MLQSESIIQIINADISQGWGPSRYNRNTSHFNPCLKSTTFNLGKPFRCYYLSNPYLHVWSLVVTHRILTFISTVPLNSKSKYPNWSRISLVNGLTWIFKAERRKIKWMSLKLLLQQSFYVFLSLILQTTTSRNLHCINSPKINMMKWTKHRINGRSKKIENNLYPSQGIVFFLMASLCTHVAKLNLCVSNASETYEDH